MKPIKAYYYHCLDCVLTFATFGKYPNVKAYCPICGDCIGVSKKKLTKRNTKRVKGEWTDKQEQQLIQMYQAGELSKIIAVELKKSYKAVESKIGRLREKGAIGHKKVRANG